MRGFSRLATTNVDFGYSIASCTLIFMRVLRILIVRRDGVNISLANRAISYNGLRTRLRTGRHRALPFNAGWTARLRNCKVTAYPRIFLCSPNRHVCQGNAKTPPGIENGTTLIMRNSTAAGTKKGTFAISIYCHVASCPVASFTDPML